VARELVGVGGGSDGGAVGLGAGLLALRRMSWLRRGASAGKAGTDARGHVDDGRDRFPAPRRPSAVDQRQPPAAGPGPAVDEQLVVGAIPHETPGLRPRPELDRLEDGQDPAGRVVHVLTGPPGTGKTQLAGAYARDKLAEGWQLVAWVNAEDTESMLAGQAMVAEAAGLSSGGAGLDTVAAALTVRHRLESDGDRCLIVFDNASDPEALRPFLPATGTARVLITSDRKELADLGASVPVGAFSPDEAVAFLASRTGLAEAEGAAELAAELGYLPLALAQAAAVIAAKHMPYATYLASLRALPAEQYLVRERARAYPPRLAEAVLLSLETIRADDEGGAATRVLEIMAVLSAAGVRREFLHAAGRAGALGGARERLGTELVDRALVQLAERSLLTFSLHGQTIRMHPLIARVLMDRLARRGRLTAVCRAAAFALDAHAAAVAGSPDRAALRDVPEQVAAVLTNAGQAAGKADHELAGLLLRIRFWALHCLNRLGDSTQQAIAVGEPLIADLQRALGFEDPDTLNARNSLAIAYQDAGRVGDAVTLHEETLIAFERMHGRSHPSTLASRNNLAEAYLAAGRTADAVALHEQTLAGYERVRGADHPDTLTSRSHLGEAYLAAGRPGDAVALHEQTLAGYERVRGADHPDTLTSRSHLARALAAAGRTADAAAQLEQVLAARERVLGADHPSTLGSRSNLANAYRAAGRVAEAVALLEQTVAGYERIRGPDHPSTLGARNNLGNAYRAAGRADEAVALHEQVLAVRQRVLGPDHPDTRQSQHNLARAYRDAGRVDYGG
jgi:tetratricopeptide (TPR) repeat protein